MSSLSHGARVGGAAVLVAGALSLGYVTGGKASAEVRPVARLASVAVLGGAAALAVSKLQEKTHQAAGIELHNAFASFDDPTAVDPGYVATIAAKYGIADPQEKMRLEMKRLYDAFLSSVIPSSDTPLRGDEAVRIRKFKSALGIDDAAAAECHMDLGTRFSRQRLESGSREGGLQELRAFQKLVFISEQVFGEKKAKFLLPWKRVFNLTDAQLNLAKRDNARGLYSSRLEGFTEDSLDEQVLTDLRSLQVQLGLSDQVAAECMQSVLRQLAEAKLDEATTTLNQRVRVRNFDKVIGLLQDLVRFNDKAVALASKGDANMAKGLGQVSLYGGKYAAESSRQQLKELYKVYAEEKLAKDGEITDETVAGLASLKLVFGMGNKEADGVKHAVTGKAYRRMLAAAYKDGTLEKEESKAGWLQRLCERLDFDPEEAMAVNLEQYQMKLESLISAGAISDEDDQELSKIQKLLCIQLSQIQKIDEEVKGKAFNETLRDILTVTADAFGTSEIMRLRQSMNNLRLEKELAMNLATRSARKEMMTIVTKVRNTRNQVDAAQELKKLVFYSNSVVTPIVEEIDPDIAEQNKKRQEQADLMSMVAKAQNEAKEEESADKDAGDGESDGSASEEATPSTLQKAKKGFASSSAGDGADSKRGQNVVTVRDDLELRDRQDLYRMYLLYCMQGEVRKLGMGSSIVLERDESEFARLIQIGEVLGLTEADTLQIHQGLAEQAFKNQAQQMMAGASAMTPEKEQQLKEIQTKLGLPDDVADKVVKGLVDRQTVGNLQALHAQGLLTIAKLRELKKSGVDIDSIMKKEARETLFKKEIDQMLSNGQGLFDRDEVLVNIPSELGISEKSAQSFVNASVKGKMRLLFVQAISFLRQRKVDEMVKTVNNVIACSKAAPSESVQWTEKEELMDLYAYFYKNAQPGAQVEALRGILNLSEDETDSVQQLVDSGKFTFDEQSVDDIAIF
eukprot:CAMPEP_0198246818 /NCGR_PEP_ID=MMETSP1446-20131203/46166_1 /TAXON_ID=1461542 ORGANISM="Unidentified sp, Strain CCMP2111" /NCGR_SAMPLE_ID=MMETSP1446 /ASSEMBLY_ACC=CAM_ASM_001112 /LENGTH=966 /DNA_ID=CAMNT_0043931141 /DNA_START=214 /DNA_END=3114 /DNA_ORIENTATION=+